MPDLTLPDPAPALPANGNNLSLSIHPSTHGGPPKTSVDKSQAGVMSIHGDMVPAQPQQAARTGACPAHHTLSLGKRWVRRARTDRAEVPAALQAAKRRAIQELLFFASVGDLRRCERITRLWNLQVGAPRAWPSRHA
jgi:hypothetical protein